MFCMKDDPMGNTSYGRAAKEKMGDLPENFRIYGAGWLGDDPKHWDTMHVVGAEFREAKSGKNKGRLTIMIPGTKREVWINKQDIARHK